MNKSPYNKTSKRYKAKKQKYKLSADNYSDDDETSTNLNIKLPLKGCVLDEGCRGRVSKKQIKLDSDGDDEEIKWLEAVESGNLHEVDDELRQIKNPKQMTVRQKAMLEKKMQQAAPIPTIPTPTVVAEVASVLAEETHDTDDLVKRAIKTQKRREMAIEKREKDKKQTLDKLLKKQESKVSKPSKAGVKGVKKQDPVVTYINNHNTISLHFPQHIAFPLQPQTERDPPKPVICGVSGCMNIKKYNCSTTNIPLCSLQCYKENLAVH